MKKLLYAGSLLLWAVAGLSAAPPKVPERLDVAVGEDQVLVIEVESDDSFGYAEGWANLPDCTLFEGVFRGGKKQFLVRPRKAGQYVISWWTKGEVAKTRTVVNAGGKPDDDGGDDGEDKKPPVPAKDVPLPGGGVRVLLVFQDKDALKYTSGQRAVLNGVAVRNFLDGVCETGPDGKMKEWRIYDADNDFSAAGKIWRDAMARPRTALPWYVVSNGRQFAEGPLPRDTTPEKFMALVTSVKEKK